MLLANAILTVLLGLPADPSEGVGERKVNKKESWFMDAPNWRSKPLHKAEDGEDVTVVEDLGKYSKVTVKRLNLTAFIESTALIEPKGWSRSAADEKEGSKMAAQGLEGQKGLNPDVEKEYRSAGGPSRDQSYKDLDAMMTRPPYKGDRAALVDRLKDFQKQGKLGDHSPVK